VFFKHTTAYAFFTLLEIRRVLFPSAPASSTPHPLPGHRYPGSDAPAVDGVSMSLEPGELLVIAGPNGSGKSSLFRALLGMIAVEHGDIEINGRAHGRWRRKELARVVGARTQREEPGFPQG